ncbi:MAG: hypothetical protein FRX49_07826 [Trebouxia sp. A1-2]|nr:MAG: hypothetical protein FRX49_07826 [Trebouxia sp. A1-2]
MVQLLDLDVEAHRTIIEQLPVQHLSAVSCTCRHFRSCVLAGSFAEKLWRNKCRQQIGEGLLSLHQAGVPQGLPPTAQYWRHLCYHAEFLDHVRWWKDGSDTIKLRADEADARAVQDGNEPGPPMKARLARSGHSVSVIGHLLVATGAAPTSKIGALVNQVLTPLQRKAEDGSVVLLFGGYNTMGQEFGGDQFEAFWASHDGSAVAWLPVKTNGHAPSARFHHTTTAFDGGRQLILYGGEGHEMIDGADNQAPNVYTLDVSSLTWHRRSTSCTSLEDSPGVRSLHIATVRQCPETGHEELVVLAGYCNNVLAAMNPHRLDLTTWRWVKESGLVPNPGQGDALALPTPRQRAAAETVGDKWLLMLGGSPTQFLQGNFLDDMHKLHLPTLTWRAPPQVHGRPIRALRNIAGHSMEGLIAFGGCIPTVMGIMPVAKADPLLIGPPPGLSMLLEQEPIPPLQTLPLHPQLPALLPRSGHTRKLLMDDQQQDPLAEQPSSSRQAAALQQLESISVEPRPRNGPQAGFAPLPLPYTQQNKGSDYLHGQQLQSAEHGDNGDGLPDAERQELSTLHGSSSQWGHVIDPAMYHSIMNAEAAAVQARGEDQQADVRESAGGFQEGAFDHWQGIVHPVVDSSHASVDAVHQGRGSKRQAPAHDTGATAEADSGSRQVGFSSDQLLHVAVDPRWANHVNSQMQSRRNDLSLRQRLMEPEINSSQTDVGVLNQLTATRDSRKKALLESVLQPAHSNAQDPLLSSLGGPGGSAIMHDEGHAVDGQFVSRHQADVSPGTSHPSQAGTSSDLGPSNWDLNQQDSQTQQGSVLVEGAALASSNTAQAYGQGDNDINSTSLQLLGGNADGSSWDPQQAVRQGYVARRTDGSDVTWVRRFPDAAWRSITPATDASPVAPDPDAVQTTTDPVGIAEDGERNDQGLAQLSQGIDRCSSCDTYDGTFTAWRVPNTTGTPQDSAGGSWGIQVTHESAARGFLGPATTAHYWRHEATGEFYTRQHTLHNQVIFVPVQGPSSQSSDSGGSPLASFQPAEDLVELPPAQAAQDQGPCLMQ